MFTRCPCQVLYSARLHVHSVNIFLDGNISNANHVLVQITCKPTKKVSKISKNMNVNLSLPHLYTKFHGQIHLTPAVRKKDKISERQ